MATIKLNDFLKGGQTKVLGNESKMLAQQEQKEPGYFGRVFQTYQNTIPSAVKGVEQGAENISMGTQRAVSGELFAGTGQAIKGYAQSVFAPTAAAVKATYAPITEAISPVASAAISGLMNLISPITKPIAEKLSDNPQFQQFAIGLEELQKKYPQEIELTKNIAETAMGIYGAKQLEKVDVGNLASEGVAKTKEILSKTGEKLKLAGEKATGLGVGMEQPTAVALQAYEAEQPSLIQRVKNLFTGEKPEVSMKVKPITEANTAVRLLDPGTEWQLGVDAKRVAPQLWKNEIEPVLNAPYQTQVNMPDFLNEIKNQIITDNPVGVRQKSLLKAFQAFSEPYQNIDEIPLPKLQSFKEDWAKFIPEKVYKGEPIAASLKEIQKIGAEKARSIIYNSIGAENVKAAYTDYGNLLSIMEAGQKTMDALRSKSWSRQMWEMIMDKAVTPVATTAGKVLYKTGEGLEFVGNKGAKTVGDIIEQPLLLPAPALSFEERQTAQKAIEQSQKAIAPKSFKPTGGFQETPAGFGQITPETIQLPANLKIGNWNLFKEKFYSQFVEQYGKKDALIKLAESWQSLKK